MSEREEILGIGWEFPPRFDKITNNTAMLIGAADIDNSIYVIIHTKLGERIFRREFGSNIYDLLFEPLNENMKTYMASSLRQSLEINEPRIRVASIRLEQPDLTLGRVDVYISFTIIETNKTNNLVIPFYTPDNIRLT